MIRQLRIVAACFCLVASCAILGLWVRSYFYWDIIQHPLRVVYSWKGQIAVRVSSPEDWDPYIKTGFSSRTTEEKEVKARSLSKLRPGRIIWSWPPEPKFFFFSGGLNNAKTSRFTFPHWFSVLLFGLLAWLLKPKPKLRFSLSEILTLTTTAAVMAGCLAVLIRYAD